MSAEGKVIALVTGGNNGIGFDSVAALASQPNYHVIIASRSLERGEKALAELKARNLPGSISLQQLEITSDESIAKAVSAVASEFGRLDLLVNNAGITSQEEDLRKRMTLLFSVNSTSQAMVTLGFADLLKKSSDPRIIYVSSSLGSITQKRDRLDNYWQIPAAEYRMSKAALCMLAVCHLDQFAEENNGKGFKVWAYCPGFVVTDLNGIEGRKWMKDMGAGSSLDSAAGILDIAAGKRDGVVGRFVHSGGVYPW